MQTNSLSKSEPADIYLERQTKLSGILGKLNFVGLALNPGPSLTYLTGLHFHLSERPVACLFPASGTPVLILPELEAAKESSLSFTHQTFTYPEDPARWQEIFLKGLEAAGFKGGNLGVEALRMRVLELQLLQASSAETKFVQADHAIAALRIVKDSHETALMRTAVKIAQDAITATLKSFEINMTERAFAAALTLQLLQGGSDPEFPFSPIVSAGPNSANPHAVPSDRRITEGDLLVVDWGAAYKGYISDLTRTFAIGTIEPEFQEIAQIVKEANTAGRAACIPGNSAESIDNAARTVIEEAGYGKYFIHRTGHGIGMEAHEEPYIRSGNTEKMQPGMSFTIEPGIYLPGRGGVRIEDNVVISHSEAVCLSDLERDLVSLPF